MNTIYFLIALYLVSALLQLLHLKIAHSPKGIFSRVEITKKDYLTAITPLLNTAMFIVGWTCYYPYRDNE